MITLYTFARGARGLRVMWLCEELSLPYTVRNHAFPVGSDYRALNPLGTVPFLEDEGGVAINESVAMMLYIASTYGPTPLLPTGGALFVRAPEKTPASLAAIAGKTVTTPRTGPLAAYLQKNAPDAKLIVTANYDESLAQLVSGQADVAALNFQTGAQLAARLHPGKITPPDRLFWELPFAIAMPKGKSADALRKLDAGIAAIRADGTFERINAEFLKR